IDELDERVVVKDVPPLVVLLMAGVDADVRRLLPFCCDLRGRGSVVRSDHTAGEARAEQQIQAAAKRRTSDRTRPRSSDSPRNITDPDRDGAGISLAASTPTAGDSAVATSPRGNGEFPPFVKSASAHASSTQKKLCGGICDVATPVPLAAAAF